MTRHPDIPDSNHPLNIDPTSSDPANPSFEIPLPGTPTFLKRLLSYLRRASHAESVAPNGNLPLDSVTIQSILLCLMAGNKHLILRTAEEDENLVVKLAALTLSTIFGYPTHRFRIRPRSTPSNSSENQLDPLSINSKAFLRSLFLPITRVSESTGSISHLYSHSNYNSQDEGSITTHTCRHTSKQQNRKHRPLSRSSKPGFGSNPLLRAKTTSELPISISTATQTDIPAEHGHGRDTTPAVAEHEVIVDVKPIRPYLGPTAALLAHARRPSTPPSNLHASWSDSTSNKVSFSANSSSYPRPPPLVHVHSDPTPLSTTNHRNSPILRPSDTGVTNSPAPTFPPTLPRGLVVSGLEHASNVSQRALLRVLTEGRLDLDEDSDEEGVEDELYTLPDGFFMIYVCKYDPQERPNIHKSLLDRFAMSTTVNLHQSTKQALRSYLSNTLKHKSSVHRSSPLLPSHPLPHSSPQSSTPITSPVQSPSSLNASIQSLQLHNHVSSVPTPSLLPESFLPSLRELCATRTHISPQLLLYTADLFSAARHHHQLDGTLLTARAHRDALDLARASRVLGVDLTGMELIQIIGLADGSPDAHHNSTGMEQSKPDAFNQPGDGFLPPTSNLDSLSAQQDGEAMVSGTSHDMLNISEADIARIVPRVLSHRLRVRDGPQDEVLGGAVFGAVTGLHLHDHSVERSTVKDILVRILSEV